MLGSAACVFRYDSTTVRYATCVRRYIAWHNRYARSLFHNAGRRWHGATRHPHSAGEPCGWGTAGRRAAARGNIARMSPRRVIQRGATWILPVMMWASVAAFLLRAAVAMGL